MPEKFQIYADQHYIFNIYIKAIATAILKNFICSESDITGY
jgi:hypothetical protein